MAWFTILVLGLLSFVGPAAAGAGGEEVRLAVEVVPNPLSLDAVGEVSVRLGWSGPSDLYQVREVGVPGVDNAEVLGNEVVLLVALEDGRPVTEQVTTYRIRPLKVGRGRVGAVEVRYGKRGGDGAERVLSSSPVEFEVFRRGLGPGPVFIGNLELALALGVLVSSWLGVFFLGRRMGRARAEAAARAAEAGEGQGDPGAGLPVDRLGQLKLEGLVRDYYAELHVAVLSALGARYAARLDRNDDSARALDTLREAGMPDGDLRSLSAFLDEVTRVRFAGARPDGHEMDRALKRTQELLEAQ